MNGTKDASEASHVSVGTNLGIGKLRSTLNEIRPLAQYLKTLIKIVQDLNGKLNEEDFVGRVSAAAQSDRAHLQLLVLEQDVMRVDYFRARGLLKHFYIPRLNELCLKAIAEGKTVSEAEKRLRLRADGYMEWYAAARAVAEVQVAFQHGTLPGLLQQSRLLIDGPDASHGHGEKVFRKMAALPVKKLLDWTVPVDSKHRSNYPLGSIPIELQAAGLADCGAVAFRLEGVTYEIVSRLTKARETIDEVQDSHPAAKMPWSKQVHFPRLLLEGGEYLSWGWDSRGSNTVGTGLEQAIADAQGALCKVESERDLFLLRSGCVGAAFLWRHMRALHEEFKRLDAGHIGPTHCSYFATWEAEVSAFFQTAQERLAADTESVT